MEKTKKRTLKILAGVVAIALIIGILFITNSFVGNPISKMIANKAIKKYVDQNYSSFDLEIEKTSYNFKDGSYMARAKSKRSIDTKFNAYYYKGKVRDNYQSYVLGMLSTFQRFLDEYSIIAKDIVAKELGYENNDTIVIFSKDVYVNASDIFERDMEFDRTLPIDAEVSIRLNLRDYSLEDIANILTDAHKEFVDNDCNFIKYGFYAKNDGMYIMINGVTPADIESGELTSLLEKAKNNDSMGEISVFIKEDSK